MGGWGGGGRGEDNKKGEIGVGGGTRRGDGMKVEEGM